MTISIHVYPYKLGSSSAKGLATALGTKLVKPDGRFKPSAQKLVINWGNSTEPAWGSDNVVDMLNPISAVELASSKLSTFNCFEDSGVSAPASTNSPAEAMDWLKNGEMVVERRLLRSHSGKGIEIIDPKNPETKALVDADLLTSLLHSDTRLFTKYLKKRHEYRVHIGRDYSGRSGRGYTVIDVQQKRKRREVENELVDYQVRNHSNGWVYCREDVNLPKRAIVLAEFAIESLGLTFGAVDLIYNEHQDAYYALEVNTAPGLEGTTLENYTAYFQGVLEAYGGRSEVAPTVARPVAPLPGAPTLSGEPIPVAPTLGGRRGRIVTFEDHVRAGRPQPPLTTDEVATVESLREARQLRGQRNPDVWFAGQDEVVVEVDAGGSNGR